jgi:hypothetical protein
VSTRARRVAALVLALGLSLGAAGCGQEGPADAVFEPGPGGVMPGDTVPVEDLLARVVAGERKLSTARAVVTAEAPGLELSGVATQDLSARPVSFRASYEVAGAGRVQLTYVDGLIYVRPGARGDFLRIDPEGAGASVPWVREFTEAMRTRTTVRDRERAVESVSYQGTEEVTGASADRYELVLDTRTLPGGTDSPGADRTLCNIWLDADDQIRRISVLQGEALFRIDFSRIGERIRITAPPADSITDELRLAG